MVYRIYHINCCTVLAFLWRLPVTPSRQPYYQTPYFWQDAKPLSRPVGPLEETPAKFIFVAPCRPCFRLVGTKCRRIFSCAARGVDGTLTTPPYPEPFQGEDTTITQDPLGLHVSCWRRGGCLQFMTSPETRPALRERQRRRSARINPHEMERRRKKIAWLTSLRFIKWQDPLPNQ